MYGYGFRAGFIADSAYYERVFAGRDIAHLVTAQGIG
jgi:hypothetical protein